MRSRCHSLSFCAGLISAFVLAGPVLSQAASLDHARLARGALEKHIRPGYQRLIAAFEGLEQSAGATCAAPDEAKLDALRGRFAEAVEAWGAIAHIHFGSIRTDNRYERIWFWPDRKAIGQRQVLSALRGRPQDYADPQALAEKSVAVQGLSALELILYGGKVDLQSGTEEANFACQYAQTIAANLKTIAGRVAADWADDGAFGRLWLNPGPDNRAYLSDRETSFALIRALMENLERVRDTELARPLGVTQSRRILPGPFSESGLTMNFIGARITGLRALLKRSGLADAMIETAEADQDAQSVGDVKQALFELEVSEGRAAELAAIPGILSDPPRRSEAVALGFPLKSARTAFANAAGRLTKLPVGYNASDGD